MQVIALLVAMGIMLPGTPGMSENQQVHGGNTMAMQITSNAFKHQNMIPQKYGCAGDDISPPLEWEDAPDGAESLALICNDPDAPGGTFTHWVVYNIPPDQNAFDENIPTDDSLHSGARQGKNDFGNIGYGGPCPPDGEHRYFFQLFALDTELDLSGEVTENDLRDAMRDHILAEGELMGRYAK